MTILQRWKITSLHNKVTVLTGIGIFGVTAIYCVFSGLQWLAISNQLTDERQDRRAWIGIVDAICNHQEVGKSFDICAVMSNSGRTFARRVNVSYHMRPLARGKEPNFNEVFSDTKNQGIIAPGAQSDAIVKTGILTQNEVDAITSGDIQIFMFGKITYEDVYHIPHWLTFCFVYDPAVGKFRPYEKYNDTDDIAD